MKSLRAILLGALIWVLIFVEISITMIGLKLSELTSYIIHYIFLIPMGIFCAWLYYKSKDKINGFLLGVIFLLVGVILEVIITIPMFIKGDYVGYFSSYYLWIGMIELVLVVGIYDLIIKKN